MAANLGSACIFSQADRVKGRLVQKERVKLLLSRRPNPKPRESGGMTPLKMVNLYPNILSLIHKQQVSALTT